MTGIVFFFYCTDVVSLNPAHGEVYTIQHYVINFVSELQQVSGFHHVLWFPPPIKMTAEILLKVALHIITLILFLFYCYEYAKVGTASVAPYIIKFYNWNVFCFFYFYECDIKSLVKNKSIWPSTRPY